jgi:hypothetical protein
MQPGGSVRNRAAHEIKRELGRAGHEVSIPVRDFVCADDGQVIFVNQGMHGIAVYRRAFLEKVQGLRAKRRAAGDAAC